MSAVLKADGVGPLGPTRPFNFEDFRGRVEERLEAVRKESRELIERAVAEAAEIKATAEREGRAEGVRQGLAEAETRIEAEAERKAAESVAGRLEPVVAALNGVADEVRQSRDEAVVVQSRTAVELAVAVAGRLLRRDAATSNEAALAAAEEALAAVAEGGRVRVGLSSEDRGALGGQVETVAESLAGLGDVEIVADETVTPGGCVVTTRHGRIDGRLETRLDRIATELLGGASSSSAADDGGDP